MSKLFAIALIATVTVGVKVVQRFEPDLHDIVKFFKEGERSAGFRHELIDLIYESNFLTIDEVKEAVVHEANY